MPQTADRLITHIDWLITVDPTRRIVRDAAIAIKDGKIAAVGKTDAIEAEWSAGAVSSGAGRVGTPGFVDNHLHSSFQMARGLATARGLPLFGVHHMEGHLLSAFLGDDSRPARSLCPAGLMATRPRSGRCSRTRRSTRANRTLQRSCWPRFVSDPSMHSPVAFSIMG